MAVNMLKVTDVKHSTRKIGQGPEFDSIVKLMTKHGYSNPAGMLPKVQPAVCEFVMRDTFASFANGIRRILVEELPVKYITVADDNIKTNDEFIINDQLIKKIHLLPIDQSINLDEFEKIRIGLTVENNTNEIIDVKASDLTLSNKKPIETLIPNSNIQLVCLRPGKTLTLSGINLATGYQYSNGADRCSLLANITYKPIDVVPYDVWTKKGTRSINSDPKEFHISFETVGNVTVKQVMKHLYDELTDKLEKIKNKLKSIELSDDQKYYYAAKFEVTTVSGMTVYRWQDEYVTMAFMLAQQCYILDPNIAYCAPTIDRWDNRIAIIKMIHPQSNKLLLAAVEQCEKNIKILYDSVVKGL